MTFEQIFTLGLVLIVFVSFVKEFYPPEVIALAAAAALVATNIIDVKTFLSVFSTSAPITIALMFIMSAALERTGILSILGEMLQRYAKGSFLRAMLLMMFSAMLASAFMNNTPVVILMTPIVISVAASVNVAPSRLLIPLSFSAIFGGTLTLVGTSTNILISNIATQSEQPAISMFEMTLPGLIFATVGIIYMIFAGRYLLPDRVSIAGILEQGEKRKFMARVLIPSNSKYIHKKLEDLPFNTTHSRILDVLRGERSLSRSLDSLTLQAGDRLVIKTDAAEILGLKEDGDVEFKNISDQGIEPVTAEQTVTMEASIGPKSHLRGKTLEALNLRRNYGIYVMAVHRNDRNISAQMDKIHLQFADTFNGAI